ncbi:S8 family peptidase [Streptomyces sp. NPDC003691]
MFSSKRRGRGATTVTTALVAAALVAGATGATAVAETGAAEGGTGTAATAAGLRWVTLITGDRIGLDSRDRVVSVDHGPGREKIAVRSRTERGRTYAVPADAQKLIARGVLDRRLFDVTGLAAPESLRAYRDGLKVIVEYEGASAAAARQGVRADAKVQRTLPSINADAVTLPRKDPGGLWTALTTGSGSAAGTARAAGTAPGIERVWLDAVRTSTLDTGTVRIGAPKAWQAGYDGKGVVVAVLDTGVDETHPDLVNQVIGSANFTSSPDAEDRIGHGTHIASTIAGTGAKSGGTYKGVAPGAKILNGKVLGDYGSLESGTIAAVDWAVAQGADIVNMSFGSGDTPEIDPLEAHINRVTKEKGVLFAVSAGNEGPRSGSVGSPGSAAAALTVGAVDDADKLAHFSSTGPLHDGTVKPDVTAPGVGITAASAPGSAIALQFGENPAGYVSISGTSMAAPHAAGAAALLKQRNPAWSGERLKAALTASAVDGGHTVFQQGTGRIAVDRAIEQTVVADETTVSFGRQLWPHTDDQPVTKQFTYRNLGTQEIVLDLAVKALDPRGNPAPAGFFTLAANKVTVPAGGTATVPFTADTRIGGDINGVYTAVVTATGGGTSVRSTASVEREVESYELTLDYLGRDGLPSTNFYTHLLQLSGETRAEINDEGGRSTVTHRLPKGNYAFRAELYHDSGDSDRLLHPKVELTGNTTVTVDARRTKPVALTVADPRATITGAGATFAIGSGDRILTGSFQGSTFEGFRVAQLGPDQPTGVPLRDSFYAQWERDASTQYSVAAGGDVKRLFTGHTKKFDAGDFARTTAAVGASVPGKTGRTRVLAGPERFDFSAAHTFALPGSRTHYLASEGKSSLWSLAASQVSAQGRDEITHIAPERDYRPGTSHRTVFGSAVHAPLMNEQSGVFRTGNRLKAVVPLFSDGRGNARYGYYAFSSVRTELYQGTTKIGEKEDLLAGWDSYGVGSEDAEYTLTTSAVRGPDVTAAGTRIDASWTFRSAQSPTAGETRTPLSTVRFGAPVDKDGTVPADRPSTYPVTVQGPASGAGLKSLRISVSYDAGTTWQPTPVTKGLITVRNPAKGKSVALRGEVTDTAGGKASVTVYDAYLGR